LLGNVRQKLLEWSLVRITHKTLSQKNGVETFKSYSKALEKNGGFKKITRLGADLAPTSRNESNGRRIKRVQILKCYGLENVGVGQIGILFKFSGGGQFSGRFERIDRDTTQPKESVTVMSQASGLPSYQGKRVKPSGLLLSDIERPFGSFVTGISAATKALATTSLRAWCLVNLPEARLHTRLWPPYRYQPELRMAMWEGHRESCPI